jgi:hypothetical protein
MKTIFELKEKTESVTSRDLRRVSSQKLRIKLILKLCHYGNKIKISLKSRFRFLNFLIRQIPHNSKIVHFLS